MLEGPRTTMIDRPAPPAAVQESSPETLHGLRDLLERLQGELKFKQTQIDALNFEVAWLKRWRLPTAIEVKLNPKGTFQLRVDPKQLALDPARVGADTLLATQAV